MIQTYKKSQESLALAAHSEENNEYLRSLQESFQERNMIGLNKEGQIIGVVPFDLLRQCLRRAAQTH